MNERDIFIEALQKTDPAARRAYLQEACGGDVALRQRVEGLLKLHEQAGSFLESPAVGPAPTSDEGEAEASLAEQTLLAEEPGMGIGPYKLLQKLGEGGMGAVWVAEQTEPVKRRVALKLIKAGMDSRQVIRRFEQERQALALMDHSNIAKVLDAGATAEGRPYFVMELVKGVPITKYCDELHLPLRERLELFVPVCQAIQHAHQKGIIHRDVKPSNVLVCIQDGKPVAKVIDFGVAKALHQQLTEQSVYTEIGQVVGTLEYMSPEQAELSALDIDTRADVYALGVLLYELLTGSTPLSRKRLKDAAILELLRRIREEEPPKPSTRLSESKEMLASVAAMRRTEPARLTKEVRGELDWIVMKCLEKDRTRRYETANGLARDIQRYLAEEAVEAGPPSARYRLRKFARRYRTVLTTAAAFAVLLLLAAVVSTWQAVRATRAERATEEERNHAVRSEADAKAVLRYFRDKVLSAGRPEGLDGGLGKDVKLRDAVDQGRKEIADSFKDRPLVEASIRDTLGTTYWWLGEYALAIHAFERAVALREAQLGSDHLDTLISRHNLAGAYLDAGRIAEATRLIEPVVKQREFQLGGDHPDTLTSRNVLANAYKFAGLTEESIRLYEQILKQRETKLGIDHPDTLVSRTNLAEVYRIAGRIADAVRLGEQTLQQEEAKLGADHLSTCSSRHLLADAYLDAGRSADALRLCEQNRRLCEAKLGPDHHKTFLSRGSLASAYRDAGRVADAIILLEQTLPRMEKKLGPDHSDTLSARGSLASAYWSARRWGDAIRLHEQNLPLMEAKLGADHHTTLTNRNNLAAAYTNAGRLADAIRLDEQTLQLCEAKLGLDHPTTLTTRNNLAAAYFKDGRIADAIRLHEQNRKLSEAKLGLDHPSTLGAMFALGVAYRDVGQFADAIDLLKTTLQRGRQRRGGLPASFSGLPSSLAETYDRAGQFAKAEPLYREAVEQSRRRFGSDDPRTAAALAQLGANLLKQKKFTDAEPLLRQCLTIREKQQPKEWTTFSAQSLLGEALAGQKKYAEAEPLLLQSYEGMKERQDKIPPSYRQLRLSEAIQRLVRLYEAMGQKDKADAWRKKLEDTKKAKAKDAARSGAAPRVPPAKRRSEMGAG